MRTDLRQFPTPRTRAHPVTRAFRASAALLCAAAAIWATPAAAFCFPQSVSQMVFSNYTPLGAGVLASSTIDYKCVGNTAFADISISTPRTITSGTGTMTFEVYQDPGRTTVMPGTPAIPLDVNGTTVTVWGFLPPQNSSPGAYTGTLTVTITSEGTTTRSRNLNVLTTNYVANCVVQPASLLFGSYDPGSAAPRDALGTISVACTAGTPYTVSLGLGNNAAGAIRQMANGAARLQYELYADAARTAVWNGVNTVSGTAPTTSAIGLPVYGRIPPTQLVAAGGYTDTVQATINF